MPASHLECRALNVSVCVAIAKAVADRYHARNTSVLSIGGFMEAVTVTVSPKFQVVIPKELREPLKLSPGQKVQMLLYDDRIELIPVRPMKKMRGFLKGIDTNVPRDADRA